MSRKVVITALNMITALGVDLESSWRGLLEGRSGVRRITLFDPSDCATQFAGQVPEEFEEYARQFCHRRLMKQTARGTLLGYVCAKAVVAQHQLDFSKFDRTRCAVLWGGADTGHSRIHNQDFWILKTMPHAVPALLSMEYGLEGPSLLLSAACASSAYAIGMGYDLVASGRVDLVLAGGSSSIINLEHVQGFNELHALSESNDDPPRASRPFSLGRDGFVMGEGAGVLVLESEASARQRGAHIYCEFAGHAMTNEAYNLMSPRPEGAGMAQTMRMALQAAGAAADDVDYINAHGTSTVQNDKFETQAIKQVFGERARRVPISSAKSMIGHTAGACGAVEAVITVMTLCNSLIAPTINFTPDPELDLDYVPNQSCRHAIRTALSNSFGFGGCNATLIFRAWPPAPPSHGGAEC